MFIYYSKMLINLNTSLFYQINYWHPLKIKLRLNINSNKVLPKVNLALTPLGLNASQLIAQFCLLNPMLYDENTFVNVVAEEVDDGNYLETYIMKLEWKNLLFVQTQITTDVCTNSVSISQNKVRVLIFLIFLKILEEINYKTTTVIYKSETNLYFQGHFATFFENNELLNFSADELTYIFSRLHFYILNTTTLDLNIYIRKLALNNAFLMFNAKFQLYISKNQFYTYLRQYSYVILNHKDFP